MRIFRTFTELFERAQVYRYCIECETKFMPKAATDLFCRQRCLKKYLAVQADPIGPIFHGQDMPTPKEHSRQARAKQ